MIVFVLVLVIWLQATMTTCPIRLGLAGLVSPIILATSLPNSSFANFGLAQRLSPNSISQPPIGPKPSEARPIEKSYFVTKVGWPASWPAQNSFSQKAIGHPKTGRPIYWPPVYAPTTRPVGNSFWEKNLAGQKSSLPQRSTKCVYAPTTRGLGEKFFRKKTSGNG